MTVLIYLIPVALVLGLGALFAFLWALKSGQYEDMDGAASRILFEEDEPTPKPDGNGQPEAKSESAEPSEDKNDDADKA